MFAEFDLEAHTGAGGTAKHEPFLAKSCLGHRGAVALAIVALIVPTIALAATVTVGAIPGKGWIQAPDNNAADAVIAKSPVAGLGKDSVKLAMAADADFVGIGRPIAAPLSDLTAGSWKTYVTGDSGNTISEAASLKFGMYRLGGLSEFTTIGGRACRKWDRYSRRVADVGPQ